MLYSQERAKRAFPLGIALLSSSRGFMTPSNVKVNDQTRERVLSALADDRFEFRTIAGIVEDTGLTPECVLSTIETMPDLVRQSPVPDSIGNALYKLKSRPRTAREIISETRYFLAGSSR